MVKRIAGGGWLTSDPLRVLANKRLIRSRPVLRGARAMARRRGTYRPYERVSLDFTLASTSNLCDVTGQLLANFACEEGRSFVLLDVPQSRDESALDYLTAQLRDLTERWTTKLRIPFDPERLRQAIRLSNQARALALEAAALREADPAPLRGSTMLGQLGILTSIFGHPSGVATRRCGTTPSRAYSALNPSRPTKKYGFTGCTCVPTS